MTSPPAPLLFAGEGSCVLFLFYLIPLAPFSHHMGGVLSRFSPVGFSGAGRRGMCVFVCSRVEETHTKTSPSPGTSREVARGRRGDRGEVNKKTANMYTIRMNFVVLSSSRGTTFQATIEAMQKGNLTAGCLGLLTDSPERGCVEKAKAAGLPFRVVGKVKGEPREEYDRRLDAELRAMGAEKQTIIAAIGWMFVLSPWFVQTWHHRILNVHPALLPKYPGAHALEDVLAAKEKETGMTIHVIDEGVDTGPILLQKSCPVFPADTHDSLKQRVQELEKEWYPRVLQMIEAGEIKL